jgi:hypothetical protein
MFQHLSKQMPHGPAPTLGFLIFAGLLLLPTVPVNAATFGELEAWCATPEAGGRPRLCSGYLETMIEGLASTDPSLNDGVRACVPEGEDRAEVVRLLLAYARDNPSSRDRSAIVGLGQAVKGRYPCR